MSLSLEKKGKKMIGVNLSGGEYGSGNGTYGNTYTYPSQTSLSYYAQKGMDVVRVPFDWERVQPKKDGDLSATELARLDTVVDNAKALGLKVVLDPHNYGSGYGQLIGAGTSTASFADFWGRVAAHFKNDSNVLFNLMNEPHKQSAAEWNKANNAAIEAIRDAGARQKILVPGSNWTGAHSWVSGSNDTEIGLKTVDPLNNYAFDVHQYMDSDSSGTSPNVVSEDIGVQRLKAITDWARANNKELFLGEFGAANNSTALKALDKMVHYMDDNADVWIGATYWAGGPWWGSYMYSIEPKNGVDKPQMAILQRYDLEGGGSSPAPNPDDSPAPTDPRAGNGNDVLPGTSGADVLSGLGGDDELWGGLGSDKLIGGSGKDVFIFDTALSSSNVDTIVDFSVTNDTIGLGGGVFTKLSTGTLSSSRFYKGSAAHDSSDRIIYDPKTGALLYDGDGDGSAAAVKFAQLSKGLALTSADFVVF